MKSVSIRRRCYQIVEKAEDGDKASLVFDVFIMVMIIVNVIAVILETVASIQQAYSTMFVWFERISVVVFTVEYSLRLWSCVEDREHHHWFYGRLSKATSFMAAIDLLAILPFYLPWLIPIDLRFLRALRLFRLFRLFKFGRYTWAMGVVLQVLRNTKEEILITCFVGGLLMTLSASAMYFVENSAQPEAFSSIPAAMWWAVATLTTVGYGDIYPITIPGKLLAAVIAFLGVGMFALPAGILGSGFMAEMEQRKKVVRGRGHARCPHCKNLI